MMRMAIILVILVLALAPTVTLKSLASDFMVSCTALEEDVCNRTTRVAPLYTCREVTAECKSYNMLAPCELFANQLRIRIESLDTYLAEAYYNYVLQNAPDAAYCRLTH